MAEREAYAFGNPHRPAIRDCLNLLGESQARLARQLGERILKNIFTGGGTEANGLACLGLAGDRPTRIAISAVEHASIAQTAVWLAERKAGKSI